MVQKADRRCPVCWEYTPVGRVKGREYTYQAVCLNCKSAVEYTTLYVGDPYRPMIARVAWRKADGTEGKHHTMLTPGVRREAKTQRRKVACLDRV